MRSRGGSGSRSGDHRPALGWKTMMQWTLVGYWTVALLGIATYRVWYA
jgi:hypothetical protein